MTKLVSLGLVFSVLALGCGSPSRSRAMRDVFGLEQPALSPEERVAAARVTLREGRSADERRDAARQLREAGASEATAELRAALRDPDPRVRAAAASALGRAGGSTDALRDAIATESDGTAIVEMATALQSGVDRKTLVRPLRKALGDSHLPTRYRAALLLLGHVDDVDLFPIFFSAVGTDYGNELVTRPGATDPIDALRTMIEQRKETDRRVVALAVEGLEAKRPEQRAAAAKLLRIYIGRQPGHRLVRNTPAHLRALIPPLERALEDPDERVRAAAADALSPFGTGVAAAGKSLRRSAERGGTEERRKAVDALGHGGELGGPMKENVATLIAALEDPDAKVRENAAGSLSSNDRSSDRAIPALIRAVEDPEPRVRIAAIRALGLIGQEPTSKTAFRAIHAAFDDPHQRVRSAAIAASGYFGDLSEAIVPELIRLLESDDVRIDAAAALQNMGPRAKAALPALERHRDDPNSFARRAVAQAIENINRKDRRD